MVLSMRVLFYRYFKFSIQFYTTQNNRSSSFSKMSLEDLIKEKYATPLSKNYITVKGFMLPPRYKDFESDFENMEVLDDDIWVCTFPKCGTTWVQEMVWMIANNLDFEGGTRMINERFPYLEFPMMVYDLPKDSKHLKCVEESLNLFKPRDKPAFIKTHFALPLLPRQIRDGIKKPKIIYVSRDPRDACVSYYHQAKTRPGFALSFEELCELFLAGKIIYGSFWDHVLPFWKMRNSPNILFLKYDDMKKDLGKVIGQVAEFLGRDLSEEDVKKLTEHLSFDSMKKNPAVNYEALFKYYESLRKEVEGSEKESDFKFMRKGVVGDHKAAMSEDMINKFEEWIEKNTQGTDYIV